MMLEVQPIRQKGRLCYAVYNDSGNRVSNVYDTQGKTQARLRQLLHGQELRRRKTNRACMCCGVTFRSAHKFNRLCDHCRKGSPRTVW